MVWAFAIVRFLTRADSNLVIPNGARKSRCVTDLLKFVHCGPWACKAPAGLGLKVGELRVSPAFHRARR